MSTDVAWPGFRLPREASRSRAGGAGRRPVLRRSSAAGWYRACRATVLVDGRAPLALRVLASHAAEMAERSRAGTLNLAFRHADSPTFEGEAASVAVACAVWGPLISTLGWKDGRDEKLALSFPRVSGNRTRSMRLKCALRLLVLARAQRAEWEATDRHRRTGSAAWCRERREREDRTVEGPWRTGAARGLRCGAVWWTCT